MSKKSDLLRYLLIDAKLRCEPRPGINSIISFLDEEFKSITTEKTSFTKLTVKRDLREMKKVFYAPIHFSFSKNSYCYRTPYTFLNLPGSMLERMVLNIKLNYITGGKNTQDLIKFETEETGTVGIEQVLIVAEAISKKRMLTIQYKVPLAKRSWSYSIHPYLIKEHNKQFYVIGVVEKTGEMKAFALNSFTGAPIINNTEAKIDPKIDTNIEIR